MHHIWEEFLKIIREEAGSQVVETWFKAVFFENWDPEEKLVTLQIPNQFVSNWIQDHYLPLMRTHLGRLLHSNSLRFKFTCLKQEMPVVSNSQPVPQETHATIQPASRIKDNNDPRDRSFEMPTTRVFNREEHQPTLHNIAKIPHKSTSLEQYSSQKNTKKLGAKINENYVFNSFVVGPSNELAHAAAYAVCQNIGKTYNPLFIYGGTGLGKTHLLHAIANEAKKKNKGIKVLYETADTFLTEFINAIRFDKNYAFREKYHHIDLLLLDDIQFFSNKDQTQEAFFHIFNKLYEHQKQIVLSSDTFPQEIVGLQNRLKSRLEWGLVVDIQTPDLETKIAILQKKSDEQKLVLQPEVADFIASRIFSNVRELEGALLRVSAFSSLTKQNITLDLAKRVLLHLNERKKEGIVLNSVIQAVTQHYNVSLSSLKSKKRHKEISDIRQIAFYMMKKLTLASLQSIGDFLGGRDHSTVIHAITKVENLVQNDPMMAQKIQAIEQDILSR